MSRYVCMVVCVIRCVLAHVGGPCVALCYFKIIHVNKPPAAGVAAQPWLAAALASRCAAARGMPPVLATSARAPSKAASAGRSCVDTPGWSNAFGATCSGVFHLMVAVPVMHR
jgi:hypothetical protein